MYLYIYIFTYTLTDTHLHFTHVDTIFVYTHMYVYRRERERERYMCVHACVCVCCNGNVPLAEITWMGGDTAELRYHLESMDACTCRRMLSDAAKFAYVLKAYEDEGGNIADL